MTLIGLAPMARAGAPPLREGGGELTLNEAVGKVRQTPRMADERYGATSLPSGAYYGLMLIQPDPDPQVKVRFNMFHSISADEHRAFLKAVNHTQNALNGDLTLYVLHALNEMHDLASQMRRLIEDNKVTAVMDSARQLNTAAVCSVLTFCAALHLFKEQTESGVVRHFGDGSDEHRDLQRLFSGAYDGELGYRLLYRLRNVLVHHSLGAVSVRFSQREDTRPSGVIIHSTTVRFALDRAVFLRAKKGVSATIEHELNNLSEDPDVLELADAATSALLAVHAQAFGLIYPTLGADTAKIRELDRLFPPAEQGDRALAAIPAFVGAPTSLPHRPIPKAVFDFAAAYVVEDGAPAPPADRPGAEGAP